MYDEGVERSLKDTVRAVMECMSKVLKGHSKYNVRVVCHVY